MSVHKKGPKALTDKELYGLLLTEDGDFRDEGREIYIDAVIEKLRKEIGTGRDGGK